MTSNGKTEMNMRKFLSLSCCLSVKFRTGFLVIQYYQINWIFILLWRIVRCFLILTRFSPCSKLKCMFERNPKQKEEEEEKRLGERHVLMIVCAREENDAKKTTAWRKLSTIITENVACDHNNRCGMCIIAVVHVYAIASCNCVQLLLEKT